MASEDMARETGWVHAFGQMQLFRGALASVALSHPEDCLCDVCKAASGDEDAFARLWIASKEKRGRR